MRLLRLEDDDRGGGPMKTDNFCLQVIPVAEVVPHESEAITSLFTGSAPAHVRGEKVVVLADAVYELLEEFQSGKKSGPDAA